MLCLLMLLANVVLLHKLHTQEENLKTWQRAAELPAGVALPALRGVDMAGRPLALPDTEGRALLLVFSTPCGYCEANWPNWRRLIREKPRDVPCEAGRAPVEVVLRFAAGRPDGPVDCRCARRVIEYRARSGPFEAGRASLRCSWELIV